MTDQNSNDSDLLTTPLDSLNRELGGRMVPFAGYDMPVQYAAGIIKEHEHTRAAASLFDVSHMGQAILRGADAGASLETLVPGGIQDLAAGRVRYTMFTNDAGGILDDLMVTQMGDHLFVVVNAACKEQDFAHMAENIGDRAPLEILEDRGLLALQGPAAADVLSRFAPPARHMAFMSAETLHVNDMECFVTRSGYSGEDGYEISVAADRTEELARLLLGETEVEPAGLGARDTLRLEAGLCLYGADIDTTTTPIEAGLTWCINKRRRAEGGFPGADVILGQITDGVSRKRVGIKPQGRAPAREGTEIAGPDGSVIGKVTSGGFGPSAGGPVAMGYVASEFASAGTAIDLIVRGKAQPATVEKMPLVPHRYATA